ncbi:intestinal mucin-like protein [Salarias fasciatus]|nr:intestinal mucin-like protein [Salarias fasciatus]
MARCIENNKLEIVPIECSPIEKITCTNGKEPVLVFDEYHCCQRYVCDCVCEGWGHPHHITFDGLYYSFQGNCSYVLMEEITPKFNLKIHIDNMFCDPIDDVSCSRSITVFYGSLVVKLINGNLNGAPQLEALKNSSDRLKLPYSHHNVTIANSGIALILKISQLDVVISFGRTGFRVHLPFQHFGSNTKGHCGTCTNNQADDCMLPGGRLVKNCTAMAGHWGDEKANCKRPPALPMNTPEPPHELSPCRNDSLCELLKSKQSVFAECHDLVSPDNFYQGCVFDGCRASEPALECTSLETYAAACAEAGVCIHWRNHTSICEIDCPSNKIHKPCGPVEQQTCEDNPNKLTTDVMTEGCFCPDGMKLFNKYSNICVEKCGCLDPERIPREFNEKFEYKCQDCVCEESMTVTCKPKVCPIPATSRCTTAGFILVNQTSPLDPCCFDRVCQCQINSCPVSNMSCPTGYRLTISVPKGKCCPEHTCEPKRVCVDRDIEYPPDSPVPRGSCEKCMCATNTTTSGGLLAVSCVHQQCKTNCTKGYTYMEPDSSKCCGKCVQTHCIINVTDIQQLLQEGETWSLPGNKCELYTCVRKGDKLTTVNSNITCPPFVESNCHPDTIQTAADGCCKTCMEKQKTCRLIPMKTNITVKGCSSSDEVDMPYCEGSCNTFTRYSQSADALQHSCACCKETRSTERTIKLVCDSAEPRTFSYIFVEQCGCGDRNCTSTAASPTRKRRSFTLT